MNRFLRSVLAASMLLAGSLGAAAAETVDAASAGLGFTLTLPERWQVLTQNFDASSGLISEVTDKQQVAYMIVVATAADPGFASPEQWVKKGEMPIALQYFATNGQQLQGQNYQILGQSSPTPVKVGSGADAKVIRLRLSIIGEQRDAAVIYGASSDGGTWYYVLLGNPGKAADLEEAIALAASGIGIR